jgi:hypothetical protein
MGSILTAIYDDYDDYKAFCECIGEEIMPIYHIKSFYEHREELLKLKGFKTIEDYFLNKNQ